MSLVTYNACPLAHEKKNLHFPGLGLSQGLLALTYNLPAEISTSRVCKLPAKKLPTYKVQRTTNLTNPPPTTTHQSRIMSLRSRSLNYRHFNVSFPDEKIVQVTLNRPDKLNCVDKTTSSEIAEIWEQFDQDESLWVGIITGVGRAFCTGADLQGMLLFFRPLGYELMDSTQNGTR